MWCNPIAPLYWLECQWHGFVVLDHATGAKTIVQ